MKKCLDCGGLAPDHIANCPHCACEPAAAQTRRPMRRLAQVGTICMLSVTLQACYGVAGPSPDPTTVYPTHELRLNYLVRLEGMNHTVYAQPAYNIDFNINYFRVFFAESDRLAVISGSSPPVESIEVAPIRELSFAYNEGDTVQISLFRASVELPDLVDAPNSFITPPTMFTMTEEPAVGKVAPDAVLNFAWSSTGYSSFRTTELWGNCSNGMADVVRQNEVAAVPSYQVSVSDMSMNCSTLHLEIIGVLDNGENGLDAGLGGGNTTVERVKSYDFSL